MVGHGDRAIKFSFGETSSLCYNQYTSVVTILNPMG